mgnify:FL=1
MDETTLYGIKRNLNLWIAHYRLGQISLEQVAERTEAYYLGVQETLTISEISKVLPVFSDVRAMLTQLEGYRKPELFPTTESIEIDAKLRDAVKEVEIDLDKFIQLNVRKL